MITRTLAALAKKADFVRPLRRHQPLIVALALLAVLAAFTILRETTLWQRESRHRSEHVEMALKEAEARVAEYISVREAAARTLARQMSDGEVVSRSEFAARVSDIRSRMPDIIAIVRLDDNRTVRWAEPAGQSIVSKGLDVTEILVPEHGGSEVGGPGAPARAPQAGLSLSRDGNVLVHVPVGEGGSGKGRVGVFLSMAGLEEQLRAAVPPEVPGMVLDLRTGTPAKAADLNVADGDRVTRPISLLGRDWAIRAALPEVPSNRTVIITAILLLVSVGLLALIGWLLRERQILLRIRHEFDLILNNTSLRIVYKDDKNNILRLNKVAAELFGLTIPEATGRSVYELNPETAKRHHMQDLEVIKSGRPSIGEVKKVWNANDTTKWNRVDKIPYKDQVTGESRVLVVATDLTEQLEIEQALRRSEERYNLAIEMSSIGTWDWDVENGTLYWSPRMKEIIGLTESFTPSSAEFEGRLHPDDREKVLTARRDHFENGAPYLVEFRLRHQQGHYVWIRARGQAMWNDAGKPVRMAGSVEDITERVVLQDRLAHLAHHDVLTGLLNRAMFQERMAEASERVQPAQSFALLCIDLDGFKGVNDTLGHAAGDKLLKLVARRLRGCVREDDALARLGGDEFAIVHPSAEPLKTSSILAARIIEAVSRPYEIEETQTVVGVSIGIAVATGDGADADRLMNKADLALYCAKQEGRGTFRFFEPEMEANIKDRKALGIDLRKALADGGLSIHYQPLVTVASNEITGFEALVRWNHPGRGMVSPVEFISVAEECGLINQIGEWVLVEACREAVTWPDDLKVAVNVSPVQFRGGMLMLTVAQALSKSGLRADRLELEITESVLLEDDEVSLGILRQLHDLGVRISLDDFGTGYSSLSYLQRFPFDKIKIDSSFIAHIGGENDDIGIVHAVVSLATRLGVATTAEGVETEEQLAVVREEGCTEMQGYLFSPPRPANEITRLFLADRQPAGDEEPRASRTSAA